MLFPIIMIGVIVLIVAALTAIIWFELRKQFEDDARQLLADARRFSLNGELKDRRRAGALANRLRFMSERRGLRLQAIGTDLNEIERLMDNALPCRPMPKRRKARISDTLLPVNLEGYAGPIPVIPVGEPVFAAPPTKRTTALLGREGPNVSWSIHNNDQIARELAGTTEAEISGSVEVGLISALLKTY